MEFTNSREIFAKTLNLIPGGVNSPARAFGAVGNPLVIEREKVHASTTSTETSLSITSFRGVR